VKRERLRPLVHAGMLAFVLLLPVLGGRGMAATAGAALVLNLFVLPRTAFGRSLRREGEPRFGGLVTYPLGVMAAFLLFPSGTAAAAWAAMALGDPAAAWAGRRFWAGAAAFLLAAWTAMAGTMAALAALGTWPGVRPFDSLDAVAIVLVWTGAGALAGALAESLDLGIDDNLPVALAAGGTLALVSP
jgi:dolichol kinase